ncbi:uncharacterized protein LOC135823264 [Sycon ciliatum]|uniref:uncharacterized protein LOC135823264 n=1 Tax=Sycon ciliatum TaxID=27933 RepID=UPI0031F695C0
MVRLRFGFLLPVILCGLPSLDGGLSYNLPEEFQDTVTYGTELSFRCVDDGYEVSESPLPFCTMSGNFSNTFPTCINIDECIRGTHICDINAECRDTNGAYTCSCLPDFTGSGTTCTGITCPLPLSTDVTTFINTPLTEDDRLELGTVLDVQCANGYELVPLDQVLPECARHGNLSLPLPVCYVINCTQPDNGLNADISDQSGLYPFGHSLTYTCQDGYRARNNASSLIIHCQADRTWSGEPLQCLDIDECSEGADDCHDNAVCTNMQPGFMCNCSTGFTGDGRECNVVTCSAGVLNDFVTVMSSPTASYSEQIQYACAGGYVHEGGDLVRTCLDSGTLNGTSPTCRGRLCDSLQIVENGALSNDSDLLGEGELRFREGDMTTLMYECNLGYALIGSSLVACTEDGSWSPGFPSCRQCPMDVFGSNCTMQCTCLHGSCNHITGNCTCSPGFTGRNCSEAITCDHPEPGVHSTFNMSETGSYAFESTVQYYCLDGYTTAGMLTVRMCVGTGVWTRQPLNCTPVQCDEVSGENLMVEGTDLFFMSSLSLDCRLGSALDTNEITTEITCNASREWSPGIPECNIVNCTGLDDPENGFLSDTVFSNGSVVEFGCNEGFNLSTTYDSLECQVLKQSPLEGVWSAREPECLIINCTFHTVSSLVLPLFDTTDGQLPYTSFINYTCVTGYEVSNPEDEYQQCQADGVWSGQPPVCEGVSCPDQVPPTHGSLNGSVFVFNNIVSFDCDRGYNLVGDRLIICQANRAWNISEQPMCSPEICTLHNINYPVTSNLTSNATQIEFPQAVAYSCPGNLGFVNESNAVQYCTEFGTLSGATPLCVDLDPVAGELTPSFHLSNESTIGAVSLLCNTTGAGPFSYTWSLAPLTAFPDILASLRSGNTSLALPSNGTLQMTRFTILPDYIEQQILVPRLRNFSGVIRCQVESQSNLESSLATAITHSLVVFHVRPSVSIRPEQTMVAVGSSVVFTCNVTDAIPLTMSTDITWHRQRLGSSSDQEIVSAGRFEVSRFPDQSTLSIMNVMASDEGTVTCRVGNSAGLSTATALLIVNGPPSVNSIRAAAQEISVGDATELICNYETLACPVNVSFYFYQFSSRDMELLAVERDDNSSVLPDVCSRRNTSLTATLSLDNVTHGQSGSYFCRVANRYGTSMSGTVNISVLVPPNATIVPEEDTVVPVSTRVTFTCTAEGFPAPLLTWHFNGSEAEDSAIISNSALINNSAQDGFGFVVKSSSTLEFESVGRQHRGTITCNAANVVDEQDVHASLFVQDVPDPVLNLTTRNGTEQTVLLVAEWQQPVDRSGLPVNYTILLMHLSGNRSFAGYVDMTVFHLNSSLVRPASENYTEPNTLSPFANYTINVAACNAINCSRFVTAERLLTTPPQAPSTPPILSEPEEEEVLAETITITWSPPTESNGVIVAYQLLVRNLSLSSFGGSRRKRQSAEDSCSGGSPVMYNVSASATQFVIPTQPHTRYCVQVQADTEQGPSPLGSQIVIDSAQSAPTPPVNLTVPALNPQNVTLTWLPPLEVNGFLLQYSIKYMSTGEPSLRGCTQQDELNITGQDLSEALQIWPLYNLCPDTVYRVEVTAWTSVAEGNSTFAVFNTSVLNCTSSPDGTNINSSLLKSNYNAGGSVFAPGAVLNISCAVGYRLNNTIDARSTLRRQCLTNGSWSDVTICTNIDECTEQTHSCDPNATCSDVPGSYNCTCNLGYEPRDGRCFLVQCNTSDLHVTVNSMLTTVCPYTTTLTTVNLALAANDYNTIACYRCIAGDPQFEQTGIGSVVRRCTETGQWNDTALACDNENECGDETTAATHNCSANSDCVNRAQPERFQCNCHHGFGMVNDICTLLNCTEPEVGANAERVVPTESTVQDLYVWNTTLRFQCNSGFNASSDSLVRTCNDPFDDRFANWSGTPATCTVLTCPRPVIQAPVLQVTMPILEFYNFSTRLNYNCDVGYRQVEGTFSRVCDCTPDMNCNFDGDQPGCEDIDECNVFSPDLNNCSMFADCSNTIGSFNCTCDEGFVGDGVVCDLAICTDQGFSAISFLRDGYPIVYNNTFTSVFETRAGIRYMPGRNFTYNNTVMLSCEDGYILTSDLVNETLRCQANETWDRNTPQCQIMNCTRPGFNTSTSVQVTTEQFDYQYRTTIEFDCLQGFRRNASSLVTNLRNCTVQSPDRSSITWDGVDFECEDINECAEGTHMCDPNAICNNTFGSFTCKCLPCFKGSGFIGDCPIVSCSLENATVPRSNFSLERPAESPLLFNSSSLNCSFLISYDCHTGYNITSGNLRRECLPDRTYTGLRPVCNFVNCTYPGPGWYATQISSNLTDPDETLTITERDNFFFPRDMVGPDRFRYLSMATFECLEGYAHPRNLTNSSRLCLANGMLDGEIHHCFRRNCSILMPRNNSDLYKLNFTNPAYPLSDIQQLHDGFEEAYRTNFSYTNRFFFDCNRGHRLEQGESNVTECLSNESWSHPEPPCSPIPCPALPTVYFADNITTQIGSLNGLFYDNEVQYTCDGGFTGSGTLKCTDPGYEHTVRPTEGTWIALEENPPWTPPDVTCHRRAQLLRIEPPPKMGETLLVVEDSTLQLACVHQGHPVATVRWFQDGVLRSEITSTQEQNEEQERRREVLDSWPSTITVPNVRRRNSGTWTCEISQARQEDGVEVFIERRTIIVEVRALQLHVLNLNFDVEDPDENVTIVGTQQHMDLREDVTDAVEELFLSNTNLNEVFFLDSIPENPFHIRTGSIIVEMDLQILVVGEDNADELQRRFNMAVEDQADIFGVLVTPSATVMAVNITARLLERLTEIRESAIPPEELADVANELYILTNANPGQLSDTDIGATTTVVGALADALADGNLDLPAESVNMIARDVFSVVDNTLQADATAAAADDAQETLRNAVTSAISSLLTNQTIAGSVQGATVVGDSVSGANIVNSGAAMDITASFSDDETPALAVGAGAMTGMASVQLTSDAFNAAACENRNETTNLCMDGFSAVFTQFTDFNLFRDGNCDIGSSSILGASVNGQNVTRSRNGETLVRANFSVNMGTSTGARCAFYNVTLRRWRTEGCRTVMPTPGVVTCDCDHLTNFAILLTEDAPSQEDITIVTYVGCGISIIGLVFTIILHILARTLRQKVQTKILIGLCVSLTLLLTFMITLESARSNDTACQAVGILTQYFLLSTFCWMAVQSVHLYRQLILVFTGGEQRFLYLATGLSFGLPFVVTTITAYFSRNQYSMRTVVNEGCSAIEVAQPQDPFCFVTGTPFFAGVYGPVAAMLVFNGVVYGLVLRVLWRRKKGANLRKNDKKENARRAKQTRASISLCFLLGVTWIIGLFMISTGSVVLQWIFTVTNSLQGFALFFFYTVSHDKLHKDVSDTLYHTVTGKQRVRKDLTQSQSGDLDKSTLSYGERAARRKQQATTTSSRETSDWDALESTNTAIWKSKALTLGRISAFSRKRTSTLSGSDTMRGSRSSSISTPMGSFNDLAVSRDRMNSDAGSATSLADRPQKNTRWREAMQRSALKPASSRTRGGSVPEVSISVHQGTSQGDHEFTQSSVTPSLSSQYDSGTVSSQVKTLPPGRRGLSPRGDERYAEKGQRPRSSSVPRVVLSRDVSLSSSGYSTSGGAAHALQVCSDRESTPSPSEMDQMLQGVSSPEPGTTGRPVSRQPSAIGADAILEIPEDSELELHPKAAQAASLQRSHSHEVSYGNDDVEAGRLSPFYKPQTADTESKSASLPRAEPLITFSDAEDVDHSVPEKRSRLKGSTLARATSSGSDTRFSAPLPPAKSKSKSKGGWKALKKKVRSPSPPSQSRDPSAKRKPVQKSQSISLSTSADYSGRERGTSVPDIAMSFDDSTGEEHQFTKSCTLPPPQRHRPSPSSSPETRRHAPKGSQLARESSQENSQRFSMPLPPPKKKKKGKKMPQHSSSLPRHVVSTSSGSFTSSSGGAEQAMRVCDDREYSPSPTDVVVTGGGNSPEPGAERIPSQTRRPSANIGIFISGIPEDSELEIHSQREPAGMLVPMEIAPRFTAPASHHGSHQHPMTTHSGHHTDPNAAVHASDSPSGGSLITAKGGLARDTTLPTPRVEPLIVISDNDSPGLDGNEPRIPKSRMKGAKLARATSTAADHSRFSAPLPPPKSRSRSNSASGWSSLTKKLRSPSPLSRTAEETPTKDNTMPTPDSLSPSVAYSGRERGSSVPNIAVSFAESTEEGDPFTSSTLPSHHRTQPRSPSPLPETRSRHAKGAQLARLSSEENPERFSMPLPPPKKKQRAKKTHQRSSSLPRHVEPPTSGSLSSSSGGADNSMSVCDADLSPAATGSVLKSTVATGPSQGLCSAGLRSDPRLPPVIPSRHNADIPQIHQPHVLVTPGSIDASTREVVGTCTLDPAAFNIDHLTAMRALHGQSFGNSGDDERSAPSSFDHQHMDVLPTGDDRMPAPPAPTTSPRAEPLILLTDSDMAYSSSMQEHMAAFQESLESSRSAASHMKGSKLAKATSTDVNHTRFSAPLPPAKPKSKSGAGWNFLKKIRSPSPPSGRRNSSAEPKKTNPITEPRGRKRQKQTSPQSSEDLNSSLSVFSKPRSISASSAAEHPGKPDTSSAAARRRAFSSSSKSDLFKPVTDGKDLDASQTPSRADNEGGMRRSRSKERNTSRFARQSTSEDKKTAGLQKSPQSPSFQSQSVDFLSDLPPAINLPPPISPVLSSTAPVLVDIPLAASQPTPQSHLATADLLDSQFALPARLPPPIPPVVNLPPDMQQTASDGSVMPGATMTGSASATAPPSGGEVTEDLTLPVTASVSSSDGSNRQLE